MQIHIINHSANPLPAYATAGSSGMDLRAHLSEPVVLKPMQRALIPTGIHLELPDGYEGQVRPRSGLALKQGISCLNSPGTIDSDYRGEVKVILVNLSQETHQIENGERIAQLVISKYERVAWKEVPDLAHSNRGTGGFGHTGTH
ncbi:MAG: dUTP diphosphatase [Bacteroidota bacterium]|nr:dUTP diphosphatase [Bacteroidota bacterium]